jgi:polyisoprenoid-binding protein YceI
MKKFLFSILSIIILAASFAHAQSVVAHSAITFKVKNLGIYTNGTIGAVQANIRFNPGDPSSASISASADLASLSTDNSMRDDHLKSDEFFDIGRYPKISLKSVSIAHKSGNKYIGQFDLTIKNKTKTVEIPFTCTPKGDLQVFAGNFKINRLDFGLGDTSLTLSDEVVVSIEAEIK